MWLVKYRTHGPWQQETFLEMEEFGAYNRAIELTKTYREVRYEHHVSTAWRDGTMVMWEDQWTDSDNQDSSTSST